jgi:hypothetical protein
MADIKKIKLKIKEIAEGSRKNVVIEDIEWIVDQLGEHGYSTSKRTTGRGGHSRMFGVNEASFNICTHHKGSKQLRRNYVIDFVEAMILVGLYED